MPPITAILLSMAGTYTLEDDGVAGNATSQLRRPDGSVITIEHPTSLLKFTASEPGVTLEINLTDSLESARLTVGDLANPTLSPETIVVRQLVSDNTVTLAATGRIYDTVQNEAEADIYAPRLILSAPGGIGENFFPLETQVGTIEAEAGIRGIWVKNNGDLVVGGLTDQVAGLDVATSGDIFVTTTGSMRLSDATSAQVVRGGGSSGNVTLRALNGISADVASHAVVAPAGNVTLRGGFGDVSLSADNDVLAGGYVFVDGRNVFLAGDADLVSNAFVGGPPGYVSVYGGGRIDINSDASITAAGVDGGNVSLQTGAGGHVGLYAAGANALQSTSGAVSIQTDSIDIDSASGITAAGAVFLIPTSINRPIMLGAAADPQTTFALDGVELNRVFASSLGVGNYNSGPVTVGGVVDLANVNSLVVRSRGDVSVNYDISVAGAVRFETIGNFIQQAGSNVTATQFAVYVDLFDSNGSGQSPQLFGTRSVILPFELFGGEDDDTLTGNDAVDLLVGNGGNDVLNGAGGVDTMVGGLGDDTFYVDHIDDLVDEYAGDGIDTILTAVSFQLDGDSEVERLFTTNAAGTLGIELNGNIYANTIQGNNGINGLSGLDGDDVLFGLGGDDVLDGGAGFDTLDGGAGLDYMAGQGGNDWYFVDNIADIAAENASPATGGTADRVFARTSYALAAGTGIEILSTASNSGTTAIDLTGNELANALIGNAGVNVLDGGAGIDNMTGLGGNDGYFVDNLADIVAESIDSAVGGTADRVYARVSYALAAGTGIEILSTASNSGTAAINLTGNELANALIGNAGANVLDGGAGIDNMTGFAGNDWYFVDNPADIAAENANSAIGGTADRVFAKASYALAAGTGIEILSTASNSATTAIGLTGNELAQSILGNNGANALNGKAGKDAINGLGGADVFVFDTALNTVPGSAWANLASDANVDNLSDFNVVDDTIHLDDAVFTGLGLGTLAAGAFRTGTTALDPDDRILYDAATGALLFDADGSGGAAAVYQFAVVTPGLALTNADFVVI